MSETWKVNPDLYATDLNGFDQVAVEQDGACQLAEKSPTYFKLLTLIMTYFRWLWENTFHREKNDLFEGEDTKPFLPLDSHQILIVEITKILNSGKIPRDIVVEEKKCLARKVSDIKEGKKHILDVTEELYYQLNNLDHYLLKISQSGLGPEGLLSEVWNGQPTELTVPISTNDRTLRKVLLTVSREDNDISALIKSKNVAIDTIGFNRRMTIHTEIGQEIILYSHDIIMFYEHFSGQERIHKYRFDANVPQLVRIQAHEEESGL